MKKESFLYTGVNGRRSAGDVYLPEKPAPGPLPVAVVCHGFKGFKDWGFFPVMGEFLAGLGFLVFIPNFSHNGCDESGREEADLDAFRANTLAFEEADLRTILRGIRAGTLPHAGAANTNRIFLAGHSRGGSAVIRAGDEAGVAGLILLASISQPPRVSPEEADKWRAEGCGWTENYRTKTRLPLGLALLDELLENRFLLRDRLENITAPISIIHGDNDTSVPVTAAQEIKSWAPHAELHILPGAGHTFGISHPYNGSTPDFDRVLALTAELITRSE